MTLKTSFAELNKSLDNLHQTLDNLLWAVIEGQPEATPGHALVDHYDGITNDLLGLVEEAQDAAKTEGQATGDQVELIAARQALISCQDLMNRLLHRFYSELWSPTAMDQLHSIEAEDGSGWLDWVSGVRDALEQFEQPLYDLNRTFFQCWQELSEQGSLISVSIKAMNTGHQLNLAGDLAGESKPGGKYMSPEGR